MTDGEAMKIAEQMDRHCGHLARLADKLREHPNGKDMMLSLIDNCLINPAFPTDVIHNLLNRPEDWRRNKFGDYRRMPATILNK